MMEQDTSTPVEDHERAEAKIASSWADLPVGRDVIPPETVTLDRAGIIDGPTLRLLRDSVRVPVRRIARAAGMSHGHLSKVERGEIGRPVTPAVVTAYERVLGINIRDLLTRDRAGGKPGWRPGQMADHNRRAYASRIGGVAAGGPLGQSWDRQLSYAGRVYQPHELPEAMATELAGLPDLLQTLPHTGGIIAHAVLGWLVRQHPTDETTPAHAASVCGHARLAAADAIARNRHEAARALLLLALEAAALTGDADLAATTLADIADHHLACSYPQDCLTVLRLAEGDERLSQPVRARLATIRQHATTPTTTPDTR